jgi:hypothetical protein
MAYDENRKVRRPSVLPKVLLGGFAVFMALGSFWGMIWFVRSIAEPPRVMALKPAVLASSEARLVPVKNEIPAPAAQAPAAQAPAAQAPAAPAPAAPVPAAPVRTAAPVAPAAKPTDGLAERWSAIENVRPALERPQGRPAEEPKPVATLAITAPPPPPIEAPLPAAVPAGTPMAGPIPLPRPRPSPNLVARAEPAVPLPRPRPETAPEPVLAEPVVQADERYPAQ